MCSPVEGPRRTETSHFFIKSLELNVTYIFYDYLYIYMYIYVYIHIYKIHVFYASVVTQPQRSLGVIN